MEAEDESARIIRTLDSINTAGFNGIGGFLRSMLASGNPTVLRRVSSLVAADLGGIIEAFAKHPRYSERRREGRIPSSQVMTDFVSRAVGKEVETIRADPRCRMGAKGVHPDAVRDFRFNTLGKTYAELAPTTWSLVCGMCGIDDEAIAKFFGDDLVDDSEDDATEQRRNLGPGDSTDCPKKRSRQKALIAIIAMGMMVFARSRRCNTLQIMMGYYFFATRTGKRPIGVLNHLGLSVSYDTIRAALSRNAEESRTEIISRVCSGVPVMLTYDNLTKKNHVQTETLLNKSVMYTFTAAAVVFLAMSESLASRLGKDARSVRNCLPEQRLPGESIGRFRNRTCSVTTARDPMPGIRRDLLLRPDPDWASLRTSDVLNAVADQEYFNSIAGALICRVLRKYFINEIKVSEENGTSPLSLPRVFRIPPASSDVRTLATMQIDESSIEGNLEVLRVVAEKQFGLTLEQLNDRIIPVSGDQLTVVRINSGQQLRVRDEKEYRMEWAQTVPGLLHTRMAMIHMIFLAHMGRPDGRDPASLWKFVRMLGRTEITAKCPNLNAAHDLLTQVSEAHVLAALIERCGVTDLNSLSTIVASGEWRAQVEGMVSDWLQLNFVDGLRDKAISQATQSLREKQRSDVGPGSASRPKKIAKADLDAEIFRRRDVVFENALLFLVHSLIYTDFHDAIRCGDSGRVEKTLDVGTVMFQGSGSHKSNYRNLTLDLKASRVKEWTPEMHELWLSNCLLNISGQPRKFITVDEFNEYEVLSVKATYNPTGTFQSTKFTCDVVSPNIMSLRSSAHGVLHSSGAPSGGYKHTHPNERRDVFAILGQLLDGKVFRYNPGRRRVVDTKPSRDLYMDGVTTVCTTDILARYVSKKTQNREEPGDDTRSDAEDTENTGIFAENIELWDLNTGHHDDNTEFELGIQS